MNLLRAIFYFFAVALIFSACSKSAETKDQVAEVRGEPIRGEKVGKSSNKTSSTNTGVKTSNAPMPKRVGEKEFAEVGFDKLAGYTFEVPDGIVATNAIGKSATQIPQDVKAFDQKKVSLKGFMLPLKVDNGLVTEMLIMKDQSMCCYGSIPRINDWVSVKMNKGVPSVMDQAVTIFGKLSVGEMLENGYLVGIYQMSGEKMEQESN